MARRAHQIIGAYRSEPSTVHMLRHVGDPRIGGIYFPPHTAIGTPLPVCHWDYYERSRSQRHEAQSAAMLLIM